MRKITKVEIANGLMLKVTYDNGRTVSFDAGGLVNRGGIFAKLSDPNQFKLVSIGPRGRSLEWPGHLDVCADAVWVKATGEQETFDSIAS